MNFAELLNSIVFLIFGIIALEFFVLAFKIMLSDNTDYQRNKERSPSMRDVLKGRIKTIHDVNRDSFLIF